MEHSIEIATPKNTTSKEVGDLLEELATSVLQTQGFEVANEVRFVASEIDLLCRHKISRERVYVECKAYRDTVVTGAQLRQLLGTVQFEKFSSGWLFSTGVLSKDAKGFVETWKERDEAERRMLRIYEPESFINLLIETSIVIDTVRIPFSNTSFGKNIKKWILLITPFGKYWTAVINQPGIPMYAVCFNAHDGTPTSDTVLPQIKATNTSINELDFKSLSKVISAHEAYTLSQQSVTYRDFYVDSSINELVNKIKNSPSVRLFDIQPVERFKRKGIAVSLDVENVGLYSAIGSNIQGAIKALSISMSIPENIEKLLMEITQASAPKNILAGIPFLYVPTKTYLTWADLYDDNLEDIIPVKLDAALEEDQAITSAIIVAAELLGLRMIAKDYDEYEYSIWVEDESGNQWRGDVDLKSSNPIVKRVEFKRKNDYLD